MQKLIEGYRVFHEEVWPKQKSLFDYLVKLGQRPMAMVIACCDSRVEPAAIFNAGPGELFIARNVANLVPPYTGPSGLHGVSAALEYAVTVLEVNNVVVLGHAMCGGIQALMSDSVEGEFIAPWVRIARRARDTVLASGAADPRAACETEAIKISLENLMTFPWVADKVAAGRLTLDGAIFDIRSGRLRCLGPDGAFTDAL